MSDGKIYITISDSRGTGGGQVTPSPSVNSVPTNQTSSGENSNDGKAGVVLRYAEHQFFNFLKSQSKKIINNGISNIGNFTGNYALQDDINVSLSALSSLSGIVMSTVAGAKIGGPVGALVAASVSIASQEISFQLQDRINRFQNYKVNREIEKLRIRSGLDTSTNGSRGTEG